MSHTRMQLDEFLSAKGISFADVLSQARVRLRLSAGDVLFACGSLVESVGNELSDVDICLLTSRDDFDFTSLNAILLAVGKCLIDVKVFLHAAVESLLVRFSVWSSAPRRPHRALGISQDERILLHRLRTGLCLYGNEEFERLQQRVKPRELARHKLDWARCHADAYQVNLAGLRRDGDLYSMLFIAQELLLHAGDAILASHGETNPNGKWRIRHLGNLAEGGECMPIIPPKGHSFRDHFLRLHRAPEHVEAEAVFAHSLRIVAFARQAFFWAERRLVEPDSIPLRGLEASLVPNQGQRVLPHLDLDVTVRGDVVQVYRFRGSGEVISLSPNSAALLCLFDGQTSQEAAVDLADRLCGHGFGAEHISELQSLIAQADLAARPVFDNAMLQRLLRRG